MYERFYQLTTNPFRLAPDPNFCFTHPGYQRAREYLEYALDQGEGFVMVTGRPGTGKTLLVEKFLKEIDTANVVARRIAVSNYSGDDLLRAVAYAYDIEAAELDKATLRHRIHHYFVQQEQAGRRVLLIIDEAQALQHTALEELRILADLQTQSRLMLQLFLIGQDSLQELLCVPDMEQFQQRVIANYHMVPLNLVDTHSYIEYRLLHAGWSGDPEFSSDAVLAIYQLSKGVPRHINKICNRLLLLGFGKGSYLFDKDDVQAISTEMGAEQLTPLTGTRAAHDGFDGIADIPELRDGRVSMADLAIRIDKVDAEMLAIAEATRLEAEKEKAFTTRHDHDPETWYPPREPPADVRPADAGRVVEYEAPPADEAAPAQETPTVSPAGQTGPVANRFRGRFGVRETLVVSAATLAITTISIAALPTIFVKNAGTEMTAHTPVEQPVDQVVSTRAGLPAADVAEQAVIEPAGFRLAMQEHEQAVSPGQGNSVPVATPPVAEPVVAMVSVPDISPEISWSDQVPDTRPGDTGQSPAHADSAVSDAGGDSDYLPTAGMIDRQSQAATVPPDFVGPLYVASAAERDSATDELQELLRQGQRSLSDYRLMTPADDNAYAYFYRALQLDPGNETAQAGIQSIVDTYVTLTKKEVDKDHVKRAYRYLDRALGIQPENRDLLALKAELDQAVAGRSIASAPLEVRPVPETKAGVTSARTPKSDSLLEGIKTFFRKRQADARSGIVKLPTGWDG